MRNATQKLDPTVTLFATDEELVVLLRMVGVPEQYSRPALKELDRDPRNLFPRKQPLWGDRRFWPAVKEYLYHQHRFNPQGSAQGLRNAGSAYTKDYGKATEAHDRRRVPQGAE